MSDQGQQPQQTFSRDQISNSTQQTVTNSVLPPPQQSYIHNLQQYPPPSFPYPQQFTTTTSTNTTQDHYSNMSQAAEMMIPTPSIMPMAAPTMSPYNAGMQSVVVLPPITMTQQQQDDSWDVPLLSIPENDQTTDDILANELINQTENNPVIDETYTPSSIPQPVAVVARSPMTYTPPPPAVIEPAESISISSSPPPPPLSEQAEYRRPIAGKAPRYDFIEKTGSPHVFDNTNQKSIPLKSLSNKDIDEDDEEEEEDEDDDENITPDVVPQGPIYKRSLNAPRKNINLMVHQQAPYLSSSSDDDETEEEEESPKVVAALKKGCKKIQILSNVKLVENILDDEKLRDAPYVSLSRLPTTVRDCRRRRISSASSSGSSSDDGDIPIEVLCTNDDVDYDEDDDADFETDYIVDKQPNKVVDIAATRSKCLEFSDTNEDPTTAAITNDDNKKDDNDDDNDGDDDDDDDDDVNKFIVCHGNTNFNSRDNQFRLRRLANANQNVDDLRVPVAAQYSDDIMDIITPLPAGNRELRSRETVRQTCYILADDMMPKTTKVTVDVPQDIKKPKIPLLPPPKHFGYESTVKSSPIAKVTIGAADDNNVSMSPDSNTIVYSEFSTLYPLMNVLEEAGIPNIETMQFVQAQYGVNMRALQAFPSPVFYIKVPLLNSVLDTDQYVLAYGAVQQPMVPAAIHISKTLYAIIDKNFQKKNARATNADFKDINKYDEDEMQKMCDSQQEEDDDNDSKKKKKTSSLSDKPRRFHFAMGEIEVLACIYWHKSSTDLVDYDPEIDRVVPKNRLRYIVQEIVATLEKRTTIARRSKKRGDDVTELMDKLRTDREFIFNLIVLSNFKKNNQKISRECLHYLKIYYNIFEEYMDDDTRSILNYLFYLLNIHHYKCQHTLATIMLEQYNFTCYLNKRYNHLKEESVEQLGHIDIAKDELLLYFGDLLKGANCNCLSELAEELKRFIKYAVQSIGAFIVKSGSYIGEIGHVQLINSYLPMQAKRALIHSVHLIEMGQMPPSTVTSATVYLDSYIRCLTTYNNIPLGAYKFVVKDVEIVLSTLLELLIKSAIVPVLVAEKDKVYATATAKTTRIQTLQRTQRYTKRQLGRIEFIKDMIKALSNFATDSKIGVFTNISGSFDNSTNVSDLHDDERRDYFSKKMHTLCEAYANGEINTSDDFHDLLADDFDANPNYDDGPCPRRPTTDDIDCDSDEDESGGSGGGSSSRKAIDDNVYPRVLHASDLIPMKNVSDSKNSVFRVDWDVTITESGTMSMIVKEEYGQPITTIHLSYFGDEDEEDVERLSRHEELKNLEISTTRIVRELYAEGVRFEKPIDEIYTSVDKHPIDNEELKYIGTGFSDMKKHKSIAAAYVTTPYPEPVKPQTTINEAYEQNLRESSDDDDDNDEDGDDDEDEDADDEEVLDDDIEETTSNVVIPHPLVDNDDDSIVDDTVIQNDVIPKKPKKKSTAKKQKEPHSSSKSKQIYKSFMMDNHYRLPIKNGRLIKYPLAKRYISRTACLLCNTNKRLKKKSTDNNDGYNRGVAHRICILKFWDQEDIIGYKKGVDQPLIPKIFFNACLQCTDILNDETKWPTDCEPNETGETFIEQIENRIRARWVGPIAFQYDDDGNRSYVKGRYLPPLYKGSKQVLPLEFKALNGPTEEAINRNFTTTSRILLQIGGVVAGVKHESETRVIRSKFENKGIYLYAQQQFTTNDDERAKTAPDMSDVLVPAVTKKEIPAILKHILNPKNCDNPYRAPKYIKYVPPTPIKRRVKKTTVTAEKPPSRPVAVETTTTTTIVPTTPKTIVVPTTPPKKRPSSKIDEPTTTFMAPEFVDSGSSSSGSSSSGSESDDDDDEDANKESQTTKTTTPIINNSPTTTTIPTPIITTPSIPIINNSPTTTTTTIPTPIITTPSILIINNSPPKTSTPSIINKKSPKKLSILPMKPVDIDQQPKLFTIREIVPPAAPSRPTTMKRPYVDLLKSATEGANIDINDDVGATTDPTTIVPSPSTTPKKRKVDGDNPTQLVQPKKILSDIPSEKKSPPQAKPKRKGGNKPKYDRVRRAPIQKMLSSSMFDLSDQELHINEARSVLKRKSPPLDNNGDGNAAKRIAIEPTTPLSGPSMEPPPIQPPQQSLPFLDANDDDDAEESARIAASNAETTIAVANLQSLLNNTEEDNLNITIDEDEMNRML